MASRTGGKAAALCPASLAGASKKVEKAAAPSRQKRKGSGSSTHAVAKKAATMKACAREEAEVATVQPAQGRLKVKATPGEVLHCNPCKKSSQESRFFV